MVKTLLMYLLLSFTLTFVIQCRSIQNELMNDYPELSFLYNQRLRRDVENVEELSDCSYSCSCYKNNGKVYVDCSGKSLTSLPSDFKSALSSYGSIEYLLLPGNYLETLPADGFSNLNIKNLILASNLLSADGIDENAFRNIYQLDQVDMRNNRQIHSLPKAVKNLNNVQRIVMDADQIKCNCDSMGWAKDWNIPKSLSIDTQPSTPTTCEDGKLVTEYLKYDAKSCPSTQRQNTYNNQDHAPYYRPAQAYNPYRNWWDTTPPARTTMRRYKNPYALYNLPPLPPLPPLPRRRWSGN
ncbi:hypothetical protein SNEBB_007060 [Seison nebaliae]|nr:hypothetical protein SNEBB_007060 [Seison nebaliae]